MATRFYPTVRVPNAVIHGGAAGTWANASAFGRSWAPVQWTWLLSTSKTDAGTLTTRENKTNQQGNFDMFYWRLMSRPLDAQAIAGTIDCCFKVQARWQNGLGVDNSTTARYKIHVYISVGQTPTVRHTLLDNYVDTVDWPNVTAGATWRQLAAPQALTAGNAQAGDCLIVEIGCRVVSSPTPAPTYPPTTWSELPLRGTGVNALNGTPFADAVDGDTSDSRAPWIECSANLTEQAAPAPPANDACADALVISLLPHTSAWIDSTESTDTERALWWTWTAPTSGKVFFHALGTNYGCYLTIYRGGCGALVTEGTQRNFNSQSQHRSQTNVCFDAVAGTQYWIRLAVDATTVTAPNSGGLARLSGFYRTAPVAGDLYVPDGLIVALRDGVICNIASQAASSAPTGVAIDYTRRPLADFNGGTHTGYRLYVGFHNFELVEIFDLDTLSYGDGQSEVDFISDPWSVVGVNTHPAQIVLTRAGMLYVGWFGNGYLFVRGIGTLPAILNTVSNNPDYSALKTIDASHADDQPGAPFTDLLQYPTIEVTAPWAIALDEATGVLFYTSGGFYEPVGGTIIGRFDTVNNVQLPDLATLAPQPGKNPGLKGLAVLPGGDILVCNSTIVQRLDATGTVVQTYTPSIPEDSQTLADIELDPDGLRFWVIDEASTRLYRFVIASGVEDLTVQPYLEPGSLVQMALFSPDGDPAAPLPSPCPVWNPAPAGGPVCRAPLLGGGS